MHPSWTEATTSQSVFDAALLRLSNSWNSSIPEACDLGFSYGPTGGILGFSGGFWVARIKFGFISYCERHDDFLCGVRKGRQRLPQGV